MEGVALNTLPGMKNDVGYGSAASGLPDWRLLLADESDADPEDEEGPTPRDVVKVLGFDPAADSLANSYFGHAGRLGMQGGSLPASASVVQSRTAGKLTGVMDRKMGFTYHAAHHKFEKTGFVVASNADNTGAHVDFAQEDFDKDKLKAFCDANKDLLAHDSKARVGAWVESGTKRHYLDIVHVYDRKEAAMEAAKTLQSQQIAKGLPPEKAIYDLGKREQIDLPGYGTAK